MLIHVKRIYETVSNEDGYRILVDRLWPRGIKKENAQIDKWFKEVAPSNMLRKWFNHQPEKWELFCARYAIELSNSVAFTELKSLINAQPKVTLLYSAKDEQYNQAIILRELLETTQ